MDFSELTSKNNMRRVKNLRAVAARYEQQAQLAEALGITPSYLSQLIGPNPSRAISERTARQMEEKLGLASGLLDEEPPPPAALSGDVLDAVMLAVDEGLRALAVRLDEAKYRTLVTHVYRETLKRGDMAVDRTSIENLIKLAR